MKKILIIVVCSLLLIPARAQEMTDSLFDTAVPLDISLSISIQTIRNSKVDTLYFKEKMYYRNVAGIMDSVKISLKRRGNFRLKECYFPPLWMKISKKNGRNTLFEGNEKLKLALPCNNGQGNNDLILREYLCYKLYEVVTSYCFKSRLVNIDFTDERGTRNKNYQLKGILIEDIDKTAKRSSCKAASVARINPSYLNDTCALRFDFFQLLIANTDWSKASQHNCKLIYQNSKYIALPYDFDMSGIVNAPYAVVSQVGDDQLPITNVTERYYRGYCASDEVTQFVREEFLSKKQKLLAVPDQLKGSMSDKEIKSIKAYLKEFFEIIKDDYSFEREILSRCRAR